MPRMQPADGARAVRELAERARRVPNVSGREEGARIEVQVVTATHKARYSMPKPATPVECWPGCDDELLDGATMYLGDELIDARRKGAVQAAMGFHEGGKGR
jgi:hypothetical protein